LNIRRTSRWGGFAVSGVVFGFPGTNVTQRWGYDKARAKEL
jgi:hypothetical protein